MTIGKLLLYLRVSTSSHVKDVIIVPAAEKRPRPYFTVTHTRIHTHTLHLNLTSGVTVLFFITQVLLENRNEKTVVNFQ